MNEKGLSQINFRGERNLWIDFIAKIKKERKTVWQILKPFIEKQVKEK